MWEIQLVISISQELRAYESKGFLYILLLWILQLFKLTDIEYLDLIMLQVVKFDPEPESRPVTLKPLRMRVSLKNQRVIQSHALAGSWATVLGGHDTIHPPHICESAGKCLTVLAGSPSWYRFCWWTLETILSPNPLMGYLDDSTEVVPESLLRITGTVTVMIQYLNQRKDSKQVVYVCTILSFGRMNPIKTSTASGKMGWESSK